MINIYYLLLAYYLHIGRGRQFLSVQITVTWLQRRHRRFFHEFPAPRK